MLLKYGEVTLREFLSMPEGYKSTTRISDLRKEGYDIKCDTSKTGRKNPTYRLISCPSKYTLTSHFQAPQEEKTQERHIAPSKQNYTQEALF
jgi:hypothetical protein